MGKNTVQAQQWLEKFYPDCAPTKTTICRWYTDFRRGRTDTNDAERSGRLNEAVTPENIKQVLKTVMEDRKLKVREIAKMVNISSIIYIDYLEKREYINSDYHIELLVRLKDEIAKKRPHMKKEKIIFHQDNAPCNKSMKTMAKLSKLGYELLPHPPYSPDLAPSDYWLFADLKKMLQEKRFGSNEEVIAETEVYFVAKDKSFYKHASERLKKRWNDSIALRGDQIYE